MGTLTALARAAHLAPTVVVTALGVLLGLEAGLGAGSTTLLGLAVLTGQLSVGWSNDLIDAERDRAVGRGDKPLVTGELSRRTLTGALGAAVLVCAGFSLTLGSAPALVHLVLLMAAWSYNVWLKSTAASWLPYVVAFGLLPALPRLALSPMTLPPGWMMVVGGLLGAGAHLTNALPDLAEDAATGVYGLPHRLGLRRSSVLAVVVLISGTIVAVLGPPAPHPWWGWAVLAAAVVLAMVSLGRGGFVPFRAAMSIALLNVVMLLARGS